MQRVRILSVATIIIVIVSLLVAVPQVAANDVKTMAGNFLVQYYNNANLTGTPAIVRTDPSINFSWGVGSPDPAINPDNFSARWIGSFMVATAGQYVFSLTTDDGARLWVDGVPLIDKWFDQPPTTYTANLNLTAAAHTIIVEYYEKTGVASIALAWGLAGSSDTFNAEYFNNMTLAGSPALMRVDATVDFNWVYNAPAPTLPPDYFSVRWTGVINFPTTNDYDFHIQIDDGARLWLDDVLILDRWYPQAPTEHMVTRHVTAGPHTIKMEYFEEAGIAVARLWWNVHVVAAGDVIVDDLSAGFAKVGPYYQASIGYNSHMFWTRNATSAVENWARWTPTLGGAGKYEVYVYIPSNYATTRSARYWIYHNGVWSTQLVNQYIYSNAWVSLGIHQFDGAGSEFVYLNDVTGEPYLTRRVGFDAVKFVYRGP